MIIDMFEKLKGFMGRLDVYVQHEITDHLKKIIVSILAQVLVVLGVATKWMKQSRLGKSAHIANQRTWLMEQLGSPILEGPVR